MKGAAAALSSEASGEAQQPGCQNAPLEPTQLQTPFCAWAGTFYLTLKAILNWVSSSPVKIKGSQSAYDGEAQGRETFAP